MKTLKEFIFKTLLALATLGGGLLLAALLQGAIALLPALGLGLVCLLAINALCGALMPAPAAHARPRAKAVAHRVAPIGCTVHRPPLRVVRGSRAA